MATRARGGYWERDIARVHFSTFKDEHPTFKCIDAPDVEEQ
jgi:hypothetical protein